MQTPENRIATQQKLQKTHDILIRAAILNL